MKRNEMIAKIEKSPDDWDIIIIGGGATGLGTAVDAASRGYKTLLLEQSDFAKGTSSRSTKLIHGGLRYLQQGNISLVTEALQERGLLFKNAPHLVHHLPFLVPNYHWWEAPFYGIGLKIYDKLAGDLGIEHSVHLSLEETVEAIPTIEQKDLKGGVIYYDGQFDDARLAIALAQTAKEQGATLLNYFKVTSLIKSVGLLRGVEAVDEETGETYSLHAKVIINATGVFSDSILEMDDPKAKKVIAPSQGVHLVLDKSFQPGKSALLIPQTADGRVLFIVPWLDRVLIGTTDTPVKETTLEPRAMKKEIAFLLKHAAQYLSKAPKPKDVLSVFAGLRPLIKSKEAKKTAALSRDHSILLSKSGLLTITGGKWTTYRKMAEDVVNRAANIGELKKKRCLTQNLHLYASNDKQIKKMIKEKPSLGELLHPSLPYLKADIIWAVRGEMARTLEDVLSRRTRILLLDAKLSIKLAPSIAKLMAKELGYGNKWEQTQVATYKRLAKGYLIENL